MITPHQILSRIFSAVLLMLGAGALGAQQPATAAPPPGGDGDQTREWLRLQTSGEAAEGAPEGQDGEVAGRVWQRYLDSFSHPIPEEFERDSFSTGAE